MIRLPENMFPNVLLLPRSLYWENTKNCNIHIVYVMPTICLFILIIVISQNFCNIGCFDNILTMQYISLVYAVSCFIFLFAVFIIHLLLDPTFIWVHCPWKLYINLKRYQKVYKSRFLKMNRLSQRKSTRNK